MKDIDTEYLLKAPLTELVSQADRARRQAGLAPKMQLCTIINAKSGLCSEDCKFCAQSAKHNAQIEVYGLKSKDQIIEAARQAKEAGSSMFGIVTSGNRLTQEELKSVAEAMYNITNDLGLKACGSLGALSKEELQQLKAAGMVRYHHNIETSKRFYSQIVTSHDFSQRINTIKAAKEVGFEVCSGGIIGLGESWLDRIDMAVALKDLKVDSVPINFLVPIKGTAMEGAKQVSATDAIRTICIFRIILGGADIKIAAGRESVLKDFQAMGFMAGANGMIIAGYLTVKGRQIEDDQRLVEEVERIWNQ